MSNILKYTIDEKNDGKKFISFLKVEVGLSTRFTRKMAKNDLGTINGKKARNSDLLKTGDIVEVRIDGQETQDIEPQDIPIDIVFEDADLLVVNKPPFMVVHPTRSHQLGTLSNAVAFYFRKTGQNCIVRLVNRLDRDTSGLVIIAKSQFAHQQMATMLIANKIDKYYIAIVEGQLSQDATIDLPIGRPAPESLKREVMQDGQQSVTHYKILASNEALSCLEVKLETGRTHQIRVHMTHMGHPLLGDTLYGTSSSLIERQALHAYKLVFQSIREGNLITLEAALPADMQTVINGIQGESNAADQKNIEN